MPTAALVLLLAGAVMHVGWNLLCKQAPDRELVTWWALVAGVALFAPALAFRPPLPRAVWPLALVSAVLEAAYFGLLVRAYAGDFSLVYPVARGSAPVFLTLWTALLLHEVPSGAGLAGIGLIVAGLLLVGTGARPLARGPRRGAGPLALALGVGLCISLYTLVDGIAARRADPVVYTVVVLALGAALLAPVVVLRARTGPLRVALRHAGTVLRAHPWRIAAAGLLMSSVSVLVLAAYRIAPLAYAGATREISVVLAAVAGWLWLGEPFGPRRIAGGVLVVGGIVVLGAGG